MSLLKVSNTDRFERNAQVVQRSTRGMEKLLVGYGETHEGDGETQSSSLLVVNLNTHTQEGGQRNTQKVVVPTEKATLTNPN